MFKMFLQSLINLVAYATQNSHWWLKELPMWLTDGFGSLFLEGGGDSAHTHESHTNMQGRGGGKHWKTQKIWKTSIFE